MIMNTATGLICIVACFYQAMGLKVTGYVGQSVVLKTGVDPSLVHLSRIQWSIYPNTSIIVVWDSGDLKEPFWRHKGRLTLNISTGDLQIKNLRVDDSLTYTVSLLTETTDQTEIQFELVVQEHLSKPDIAVLFSSLVKDTCIIALRCSIAEAGITLSWAPPDGFDQPFWNSNNTNNSSELWTSIKPHTNITFTCNASDSNRKASSQKVVQCQEEEPKDSPQFLRHRYGIIFALLFFCITILLFKVHAPPKAILHGGEKREAVTP
ncbi:uncharacterized protein si:cabz01074946.1 isoform X1 [Astyanax mexicanus]|uniref:uncharacterized protein si:cabz01074946.1 isoform X1 n=1 Tax=Astyanax mexicanus TaxID=7994 RepID=UPI0020CABD89|nr:uncharacterized protein si:cabz01074946.1 isoform X1 [Astyanax mexicanus]